MLIIVTNARTKLAALRIILLLGLLLLIGLSFNNIITDVVKSEDLDHAPGQPVRVENPAREVLPAGAGEELGAAGKAGENKERETEAKTPGETKSRQDWLDNFVSKLKEYYRGGR